MFYEADLLNLNDVDGIFSEEERSYLDSLTVKKNSEAKKSLYCAKFSIMKFLDIGLNEIKQISLLKGVFGQPVVIGNRFLPVNVGISISHTSKTIGIVVFDQLHPMGIDVEQRTKEDSPFLEEYLTEHEREMIQGSSFLSKEILFSAKESLSKILKTGLTTPLQIFEISRFEVDHEGILLFFSHFTQYQCKVVLREDQIRSVTFPINSTKVNG